MKTGTTAASVWCLAVVLVAPVSARQVAQDLLALGVAQLEAARAAHTDASYQVAEETFTTLLASEPAHAQALAFRGNARVMRGVLSLATSVRRALEQFQIGMADMDRAVSIAPGDLKVRLTRGLSYVEFPASYNKAAVAREDLEVAIAHPAFQDLPQPLREQAEKALGRARAAGTLGGGFVPREVSVQ